MVCKKCGKTFSDNLIICPHCGTENHRKTKRTISKPKVEVKKVKDVKDDDWDDWEEEKPKKKTKKAKKFSAIKLSLIILIVFVALLVAIFCISKYAKDKQENASSANIEKLEKYYQNEDYEAMGEYLESLDYDVAYAKYNVVDGLYGRKTWQISSLKKDFDVMSKEDTLYTISPELISFDIKVCFETLAEIEKLKEAGYQYGEEAACEAFKEEYHKALKKYLLLSDEEIDAAVATAISSENSSENDYLSYAEAAVMRLSEKYVKSEPETQAEQN